MAKYVVNVNEVPVGKIPGRETRDLINGKTVGAKTISLRITDVMPGEVCTPGHTHTECEEVIYIPSRGKATSRSARKSFP